MSATWRLGRSRGSVTYRQPLPGVGTEDLGRFGVVFRDDLQPGHQDDHDDRRRAPGLGQDGDEKERHRRLIAEERDLAQAHRLAAPS